MPINPCSSPEDNPLQITDTVNSPCDVSHPTLKDVPFIDDINKQQDGLGEAVDCDPMTSGHIVNDTDSIDHGIINRDPRSLYGTDEAMRKLFSDLVTKDIDGKAKTVPIIWGSQESAVAAFLQTQVRKDNTTVIDRVILPAMAIRDTSTTYAMERYTYHEVRRYFNLASLNNKPASTVQEKYPRDTVLGFSRGIPVDRSYELVVWTKYLNDMNSLVEQILLKFSNIATLYVQGVNYEVIVKLTDIQNNLDVEPGEQLRIIKYVFNFVAETYIPQPIIRKKANLKTVVDITDPVTQEILQTLTVEAKE